jgi:peptide/nickel transport system permease protein
VTHAFARAALRRVAATVGFVALVATAAFVLTRLAPGDPTLALRASGASEAVIAHERARRGLDQPLTALAADWLRGALRGDLGESVTYGRPVRTLVAERAVYTAQLAAGALIVALIIGVPLGILGGAYPRHWASRLSATLSLALVSCPPMVAALALLWIAATTQWMSMEPGAWVLPTLALGVPLAASIERLQSQAVREAMGGLEVVAAAARGIPPARLLWIHVARQSLRPLLGIFGVVIGSLFSGSLIVEVVTSWPGLGRLTYDALRERDIYLVAGCAMAGAVCLSAGQWIADAARTWADPRVRTPR